MRSRYVVAQRGLEKGVPRMGSKAARDRKDNRSMQRSIELRIVRCISFKGLNQESERRVQFLRAASRIPGVRGCGRIIEPDTAALSNLNRYVLLLRSRIERPKTEDFEALFSGALRLEGTPKRFDSRLLEEIGPLAPSVLVGVDHIPTRWAAQEAPPEWLGIGATTHWSAMASYHVRGLGCARCLHAEDDPGDADIPTVAFVSFWAGLLLATYFLRHRSGVGVPNREQQIYLTPFRAEKPWRAPIPFRRGCPTCLAMRGERFAV